MIRRSAAAAAFHTGSRDRSGVAFAAAYVMNVQ
jgi:hypothetical protein